MDFRDRFPDLKYWPSAVADRCHWIFPYNRLGRGALLEYPAPDDSTSFLVIAHFDESKEGSVGRFFCYGVEAPLGYEMRTEFERGRINWTDFMSHRNWLIELTSVLFDPGPIGLRYVSWTDVHPSCKESLIHLDGLGGPYHMLHENLKRNYEVESSWNCHDSKHKNAYIEFLAKYGDFLGLPLLDAA
ncbi:MAG: hypothetical protein NT027_01155 [Proteobacteria bacterium]|nr:hypothetical protein [Pseudomonadota bacterium]